MLLSICGEDFQQKSITYKSVRATMVSLPTNIKYAGLHKDITKAYFYNITMKNIIKRKGTKKPRGKNLCV